MSNIVNKEKILLVGTGSMALEYVKVLSYLQVEYEVVGRSERSCTEFTARTGKLAHHGGVEVLDKINFEDFTHAIVATKAEALDAVSDILISKGIFRQLLEKPGAISFESFNRYISRNKDIDLSEVFIAYNRRFYASVNSLKHLVSLDGGLTSIFFEFSEWTHKIDVTKKKQDELANWFFLNSTHVVDLAFYIAGNPSRLMCVSTSSDLKWHEKSIFAGCGITDKGVLFSYAADWNSAGRWRIECHTEKNKYILAPLEGLKIQARGSLEVNEIGLEKELETQFKPGLFDQVSAFLKGDYTRLINAVEHNRNIESIYKEMLS